MGEYAQYKGQNIKIGTCESMYYLRADQAHLVTARSGNVDPVKDAEHIRFRFPWPDEDHIEPGHFENFDRSLPVPFVELPEIEHYGTQFTAAGGYSAYLPCPAGQDEIWKDRRVNRSSGEPAVALTEQRYWDGLLVAVCRCVACGAKYRLQELSDAQPLIDGLHVMARIEQDELAKVRLRTITDRVLAGYQLKEDATV